MNSTLKNQGIVPNTPQDKRRPLQTSSSKKWIEKNLAKKTQMETSVFNLKSRGPKMAISRDGHPRTMLTKEESKEVWVMVCSMLWKISLAEVRNIDRIVYHLGTLQNQCANRDSADQFLKGLSTGVPFGEDRPRVKPWEQLLRLIKAMMWLPSLPRTPSQLLE